MLTLRASFFIACLTLCSNVQAGMIDKEGMAPWEICGLCHSLNGISVMSKFPKLAGQKASYIKKQFLDFKNHQRTNDGGQMESITLEVNPNDIDAIAEYFSGLEPPKVELQESSATDLYGSPKYQAGKQLFMQGRESIPACVSCHGEKQSSAPWLYAQHGRYLKKQLEDFASDSRENDIGGVMRGIASQLSEADIEALGEYLEFTQPRTP